MAKQARAPEHGRYWIFAQEKFRPLTDHNCLLARLVPCIGGGMGNFRAFSAIRP
jgi:hypothetical protein